MGTEFWWIYDAAIVVFALIMIIISAKRGFSKILLVVFSCVLSIVISIATNESLSPFIYKNVYQGSNRRAINRSFEEFYAGEEIAKIIEDMDYNVRANEDKINNVIEDEKTEFHKRLYRYVCNANGIEVDTLENFTAEFDKRFSDMLFNMLSENIQKGYLGGIEDLAQQPDKVEDIVRLIKFEPDEGVPSAIGKYIEENCLREDSTQIISIIAFAIVYIFFMIIFRLFTIYLNNIKVISKLGGKSEGFFGALLGGVNAAADLIIISLIVKFAVVISRGEKFLLNEDVIEKTYIFKYLYNLKIMDIFKM